MHSCMSGWVGERVGGYLGIWVDGKTDDWMNGQMIH